MILNGRAASSRTSAVTSARNNAPSLLPRAVLPSPATLVVLRTRFRLCIPYSGRNRKLHRAELTPPAKTKDQLPCPLRDPLTPISPERAMPRRRSQGSNRFGRTDMRRVPLVSRLHRFGIHEHGEMDILPSCTLNVVCVKPKIFPSIQYKMKRAEEKMHRLVLSEISKYRHTKREGIKRRKSVRL